MLVVRIADVTAHPLSTSRSELRTDAGLTRLSVWMPLTELEHIRSEDRSLTRHFRVNGQEPVAQRCRLADAELICEATFLVPKPREVETTLPARVLPHHLHLMKVGSAQRVFTVNVTRQAIDAGHVALTAPLVIFALLAALAAAVLIKSSRSRRSRRASG